MLVFKEPSGTDYSLNQTILEWFEKRLISTNPPTQNL